MRRRTAKRPSMSFAGMRATARKSFARSHGSSGEGWKFGAWPNNRPLYNLPAIGEQPNAPIIICEGEKAADAAARIFPSSIATTSSGGAGAAAKTDWAPLAARRVFIWPDQDAAGEKYARELAAILARLDCTVSIVDAKALATIHPNGGAREPAEKWDAADAVAEWRDLAALRKAAWGLRKAFDPAPVFVCYGPFEMTAGGLHIEVEKGRGENKTKGKEWICAPFEILAPAAIRKGAPGANICAGAMAMGASTSSMSQMPPCKAIHRRFALLWPRMACGSIVRNKGPSPTIYPVRGSTGA